MGRKPMKKLHLFIYMRSKTLSWYGHHFDVVPFSRSAVVSLETKNIEAR
jgi:hypothetical protein